MPDAVPYNGLGQIIGDGGVIAAANLLGQGESYGQVVAFFQERYEGAPDADLLQLIGLATVGIAAGSTLTAELAESIPFALGGEGEQLTVIGPDGPVSLPVATLAELVNMPPEQRGGLANAIDIESLPVIPDLFGAEPLGRRAELSLDVGFGTSGEHLRVDVDLAGVETWADLLDLIESRVGQIEQSDPERFSGMDEEDKFDIVTRILYGSRRW